MTDDARPALPQLVERLIEKWRADAAAVRRTLSPGTSLDVQRESLRHIIELERCANELEAALAAQGAPAWQPMDIPLEALQDAVGLVASERNKWEHAHRKTYQHWVDVYTKLAGLLLAEQVRSDLRTLPAPPRVGRAPHEEKEES